MAVYFTEWKFFTDKALKKADRRNARGARKCFVLKFIFPLK